MEYRYGILAPGQKWAHTIASVKTDPPPPIHLEADPPNIVAASAGVAKDVVVSVRSAPPLPLQFPDYYRHWQHQHSIPVDRMTQIYPVILFWCVTILCWSTVVELYTF